MFLAMFLAKQVYRVMIKALEEGLREKDVRCTHCDSPNLKLTAINDILLQDPASIQRALEGVKEGADTPILTLTCQQCGNAMRYESTDIFPETEARAAAEPPSQAPFGTYSGFKPIPAAIGVMLLVMVLALVVVGRTADDGNSGSVPTPFWPAGPVSQLEDRNAPTLVILFDDDCAWCRGNNTPVKTLARANTPAIGVIYLDVDDLLPQHSDIFNLHDGALPAFYILTADGVALDAITGNPSLDEVAVLFAEVS